MNLVIQLSSSLRESDPAIDKSDRWKIKLIGTEPKYQWTELLKYALLGVWLRFPVKSHIARRCKKFVTELGNESSK